MKEIFALGLFGVTCGFLLLGYPVAFTLAGTALGFALLGNLFGLFDFALLGALIPQIFGRMTNPVLIAVPLFVFMGVMLERSKVAEDLLETMGRLFGQLPGGLGIAVTVVGALLAASTGIVGATVVTMGLLSLPVMLKRGYDPKVASGAICAAGTLGQIIPPSIVLVLLGEVLSSSYQQAQLKRGIFSPETVSVGDLFAGALLPGLLLVGMYLAYQVFLAWWRPQSSPAIAPDSSEGAAHGFLPVARVLLPPVALIVAVLGSILGGIATPTEAAAVGAVGAGLLAARRLDPAARPAVRVAILSMLALIVLTTFVDLRPGREHISPVGKIAIGAAMALSVTLTWGTVLSFMRLGRAAILGEVVRATLSITSMVFVILIGAALFALVFRGLGGDDIVHAFLHGLPGGVVGATIVVMAVMFVLGFFLDFIEIIYVVVPIVAPPLLLLGVDPVWLGVLIAVNLQTSFLTPPFGFALFYLRGIAPSSLRTQDIYRGVVPYVLIQLVALVVLALVPGLALWLPKLLYG